MKYTTPPTTKTNSRLKGLFIGLTTFAVVGVTAAFVISTNNEMNSGQSVPGQQSTNAQSPKTVTPAATTTTASTTAQTSVPAATPAATATTASTTASTTAQTSVPANSGPLETSTTPVVDAQISQILEPILKAHELPGMAAAVIVNGKIVGAGVTGVRKNKSPELILRNDPFHLGSCTKALTATMIGVLVDEGKLNWNSTVAELIGSEIGGLNPDYAAVTIDQLLHHRSGAWPNGPSEVWQAAQRAKGPAADQRRVYVEAILSQPPRFTPGKYLYSNAGYAILGFIAEIVTKIPYEQLMQQKVFAPLALTSAGFGNAGSEDSVTAPYPHIDSGMANFLDNPEAITAAGRIHMNITDWAKFCLLHLGHQPNPPLLKPETLEHLHTLAGEVAPDKFGYACGWMRPNRDWAGGRTLHHAGSNTLNYCAVWLSPQKDFGVLVATNEGGKEAETAIDEASSALIGKFLPAAK